MKTEIKDNDMKAELKDNTITITDSAFLFCNSVNGLHFSFGGRGRSGKPDHSGDHPFINRLSQDVFIFVLKEIDNIQREESGSDCSDLGYDPDCGLYFKLGACEQEILRQKIKKIVENLVLHHHSGEPDYIKLRNILWTAVIHYLKDHHFFDRLLPESVRDEMIIELSPEKIKPYYDQNIFDPNFQIEELNDLRVFENEAGDESERTHANRF